MARDGTADSNEGGQAPRARLAVAARAELARTGLRLSFAEPLRSRYEADISAARAGEQRRTAFICITAYAMIVPLINLLVIAEPRWPIAIPQTIVPIIAALIITAAFFRADVASLVREGAMLTSALVFCATTLLAIWASPPETALTDLFLVTLPVLLSLFFLRLPVPHAVILTAISAIGLGFLSIIHGNLPHQLRFYPLGFLLTAAVPALLAVHRQERATRRAYLHAVLQTLQIEQLAYENGLLSELSATDAVTGAANRRRLDLALTELCSNPPAGDFLLLADIDHFKYFNDQHGHLAGDACLREVVRAIQGQLRHSDLLARFGGEEFAIILTGVAPAEAHATAQRILTSVAVHRFATGGGLSSVTVSIGIAARGPDDDPRRLVMQADAALYAAKNTGRNCVRWPPTPVLAES